MLHRTGAAVRRDRLKCVQRVFAAQMVDKLDYHIPESAEFRPRVGEMFRELRDAKQTRESRDYRATLDLRPYGHSAILHYGNKHKKGAGHKLELVDTGFMTGRQLQAEPHEIFQLTKSEADLRIMRVDLCADIPDVPVPWFKERVRVEFKRRHREEGVEEFRYTEDGKKRVQTLYYGTKPNQFRIYDKVDEYKFQYEKFRRGEIRNLKNKVINQWLAQDGFELPTDGEQFPVMIREKVRAMLRAGRQFPTFQEIFNIPENGYTLTRFERQIGGGKYLNKSRDTGFQVQKIQVRTVKDLNKLPEINPFEPVHVLCRDSERPDPQIYDRHGNIRRFQTHCTGLFLKRMAEEYGMQRVIDFINSFPSRQAHKKMLTIYRDYLPESPEEQSQGVTKAQIFDFYYSSVTRQLAA